MMMPRVEEWSSKWGNSTCEGTEVGAGVVSWTPAWQGLESQGQGLEGSE